MIETGSRFLIEIKKFVESVCARCTSLQNYTNILQLVKVHISKSFVKAARNYESSPNRNNLLFTPPTINARKGFLQLWKTG